MSYSRSALALLVLFSASLTSLLAQDVTITAPAFLNPETTTGDTPPAFKKKPSVDYPDELRGEETQGYALTFWTISAEGQRMIYAHGGTHPYFTKAGTLTHNTETTLVLKDGKPVMGLAWYAVIFNPATASAKKKDACPRLLAVAPAQVTPKELGKINLKDLPAAPVTLQVDATGAITDFRIDDPAAEKFRAAIAKALQQWKIAPARKDGVPQASECHVGVVLCPPMLAAIPATEPKLITSVDPIYPPELISQGIRGDVNVQFTINEAGEPINAKVVKTAHPAFSEAALAAIKQWRFTPSTRNNLPTTINSLQIFAFTPDNGGQVVAKKELLTNRRPDVAPKLIDTVTPLYPRSMNRSGLRGEVTVTFIIDTDGRVAEAAVVKTSHPNFSEPALEAIRQWKFKPAMLDGKPVRYPASQNIQFSLPDRGGGDDAFTVEGKRKNLEKLPTEFQYDTAPRVITATQPVYPYELFVTKTKGSAHVVMMIDPRGKITETKILKASAPEFGYALAAAIAEGTFAPALKNGEPCPAIVNRTQDFDPSGSDLLTTDRDRTILNLAAKKPEKILRADQLDKPLAPSIRTAPKSPTQSGSPKTGKAVIEIIVDEDGTVLLPKIIEATAPEFGYAAAQAVKQWVFTKPTAGGKPVIVRVRVPFEFKPEPTK